MSKFCLQCHKEIEKGQVCLDCTFSNVEHIMGVWGWAELHFANKEIKIVSKTKEANG